MFDLATAVLPSQLPRFDVDSKHFIARLAVGLPPALVKQCSAAKQQITFQSNPPPTTFRLDISRWWIVLSERLAATRIEPPTLTVVDHHKQTGRIGDKIRRPQRKPCPCRTDDVAFPILDPVVDIVSHHTVVAGGKHRPADH